LSVLHIPPLGDGKLAQLVDDHWAKLQKPRSQESIEDALEMGMFPAFSQYTAAEVWKAIEKKRAAESSGEEDEENLKMPEWRAFSNPGAQPPRSDFKLEEAPPPRGYEHLIERTVLVQRIREVRALMGFTRIESPGDFFDDTKVPEERRAPLSRNAPTWLPATEVRGEGLFIQFKHSTLSKWRNSSAVKDRELELFKAHRAWRAMRKIEPAIEGFPGIVYIAVHSLSHALMRQLSLECGYTAASIRERIYIRESDSASERMAGLLIYTAAPDSEGTLGGLVSLGDPDRLGALLDQALEHAKVCSSDPLCAEHDPVNALTVHGAACHGCLFAPETSCERGNKYLDRWTLVNTYASEGVGLVEQGV